MKTQAHPAAVTITHRAVAQSEVFRTDGNPIDLPRALRLLAYACHTHDMDESAWGSIGEFTEAPLGDLIAGAYWSCAENHSGQSSPAYAALCALGQVFKPGPCARGPEPDTCEQDAYTLCNEWFAAHPRA